MSSWGFRAGQSNKSQGQFCLDGLTAIAQGCRSGHPWEAAGQTESKLQHSPGTWPHPPDPDKSKQIVWLGPAAGNQHKILLLSIRVFQPSFCTLVAQCNDWKGTFLKVSVKGSQAIKDSANSPLRLLNVTLYCFRGAKQPYLDQKHGLQVSRDKRPQH